MIGLNREVDEETAGEVAKLFVEAIAAPAFEGALTILKAKKNLRLVKVNPVVDPLVVKSISGGYLAQTADLPGFGDGKAGSLLPRLHRWQTLKADAGRRYDECRDCGKFRDAPPEPPPGVGNAGPY